MTLPAKSHRPRATPHPLRPWTLALLAAGCATAVSPRVPPPPADAGGMHAFMQPQLLERSGGPARNADLDRAPIRAVIQGHADEIRACYAGRLAAAPGLRGRVAIRWTIRPDGTASDAEVDAGSTTLQDAELHACMKTRLESWRFPPSGDGETVRISYPWTLRPVEGP